MFRGISLEGEANVRVAIIGGNMDFSDAGVSHTRVGKLVADQLVQFLSDALADPFMAVRVHALRIAWGVGPGVVFFKRPFPLAFHLDLNDDATGLQPGGIQKVCNVFPAQDTLRMVIGRKEGTIRELPCTRRSQSGPLAALANS